MKIATVRELRNDFARVSVWIRNGEEVTVTRAGKPFARLSPLKRAAAAVGAGDWPDLAARRRRLFPAGVRGTPVGDLVAEQRGER